MNVDRKVLIAGTDPMTGAAQACNAEVKIGFW